MRDFILRKMHDFILRKMPDFILRKSMLDFNHAIYEGS